MVMSRAVIGGGENGPIIIELDPLDNKGHRTVKLDEKGGITYEKSTDANAQEKDGQEENSKEEANGGQEKNESHGQKEKRGKKESEPVRKEKKDEVSSEPSSGDDIVSEIVS